MLGISNSGDGLNTSLKENTNADALSRCPADESRVCAVVELKEDRMLCLPDLKEVSENQLEDLL